LTWMWRPLTKKILIFFKKKYFFIQNWGKKTTELHDMICDGMAWCAIIKNGMLLPDMIWNDTVYICIYHDMIILLLWHHRMRHAIIMCYGIYGISYYVKWYDMAWYDMHASYENMWDGVLRYHVIRYDMTLYAIIWHDIYILCCNTVWYHTVLYDIIWY
jgi:hypothetical protein